MARREEVVIGDITRQLRVGLAVIDAIGTAIGTVAACDTSAGWLMVGPDTPGSTPLYVPFTAIQAIDGQRVVLSLPQRTLQRSYRTPPSDSVDAAEPGQEAARGVDAPDGSTAPEAGLSQEQGATVSPPGGWWARAQRMLGVLGPGIITGASGDDPSGIGTYSQTGAQFGYGQLWTSLFMLPMLVAVQEMCASIGLVTGKGLAGVLRAHYPRALVFASVGLLLVANTINLGADLAAMAAAAQLLVPLPTGLVCGLFALTSIVLEVAVPYRSYVGVLKWLCISLLAYVLTGIVVTHDWGAVVRATLVPHIDLNFSFLLLIVALFGTTISPYMFFWQASEEVEEELERGQLPRAPRQRMPGVLPMIGPRDISAMRLDTWSGMIFSQATAWFIILTTAGSLHRAGKTTISSAAEAAHALRPLVHGFPHAGYIASAIFAAGIIGLGLLAIPVFAGSASYAVAEALGWQEGLSRRLREAPQFYGVMIVAVLAGLGINVLGINPMHALVYAAAINGVVAAPVLALVLLVSTNPTIMGPYVNRRWVTIVGWATCALMGLAALSALLAWKP
jgi:Mn2+/Fe2+ NRAMP family transporter